MCNSCIDLINNCLTCKKLTSKFVEISTGVINCLEETNGYYLPTDSTYYKRCPIYCLNCTSDTNCTLCETNTFLAEISSSKINCISSNNGYYLPTDSTYYKRCPIYCLNCTSDTNCTLCEKNTFLAEISSSKINCIFSDKGYYLPTDSIYYKRCPIYCLNCTSDKNCTLCETNTFLAEISSSKINCISSNNGYYLNKESTYYKRCLSPCATCQESSINCKSCEPNYYLAQIDISNLNCISDITDYYLFNTSYYVKCPSSCKTCISASYCTSCNFNYFLVENNQGQRLCQDNIIGYFLSLDGSIRKPCSINCLSCEISESNCTSCDKTKNLAESSNNSLYKTCITDLTGYLLDLKSNYYKLCSPKCKTCENNENNCKSCYDGFYLVLTPTNSFECRDNIFNFFLISGQNYYQQCAEKCATCIDFPTKCLTCNSAKFYISVKNTYECVQKCPDGYWQNFIENQCQLCHPSCKKCLDDTSNCLECFEGYFPLKENKNLCFKECPFGYILNSIDKYCELSCISPCNKCSDPNNV